MRLMPQRRRATVRRVGFALAAVVLAAVVALPALALNISGTRGNDTLRGTAKADKINGKAGNDRIFGVAGNDTLIGGPGRDRVDGGPGDDRLVIRDGVRDTAACGTGRDTVIADTADAVGANCENILRPTPPSPPPPPVGSTRDNPLPLGQPVSITADSEQWRFRILSTVPDATALILAENQFNDPPAAGFQFFMAAVEVTYVSGPAPQSPWQQIASDLNTVGDANVAYSQYSPSCGVTPDDLVLKGDLFPGGTMTGNICWPVRSSDAASLVAYFEFSSGLYYMGLR